MRHVTQSAKPKTEGRPAMAFRSEDQDYRWPLPGHQPDLRHEHAQSESSDSLSLQDTLRELAITVAGFVGVILLITTAIKFLHG
jgi:hypothetical protein